jgi:hypothetical protein
MKRTAMPDRKTGLKRTEMAPREAPLTAKTALKTRSRLKARKVLGRTKLADKPYAKPLKSRSKAYQEGMARRAEWSNAVWAKDLGVCQAGPGGPPESRVPEVRCRGGLDPHHTWPKGAYPEHRYDVSKGKVLCRAHHDWAHAHSGHRGEAIKRKLMFV